MNSPITVSSKIPAITEIIAIPATKFPVSVQIQNIKNYINHIYTTNIKLILQVFQQRKVYGLAMQAPLYMSSKYIDHNYVWSTGSINHCY